MAYDVHCFFFFNDTATTEIYTLSLHDALPISRLVENPATPSRTRASRLIASQAGDEPARDRKSTRLNSSHQIISYSVFCLKKKTTANSSRSRHHRATISSKPMHSSPHSSTSTS